MYHGIFISHIIYSITEMNYICLQCIALFVQDSVFDAVVFIIWLLLEATVLIFEVHIFYIC
jgi:hypothetical protein